MRNRVDYLAESEARMLAKIERMRLIMLKREKVILDKWKDQEYLQSNMQS